MALKGEEAPKAEKRKKKQKNIHFKIQMEKNVKNSQREKYECREGTSAFGQFRLRLP